MNTNFVGDVSGLRFKVLRFRIRVNGFLGFVFNVYVAIVL